MAERLVYCLKRIGRMQPDYDFDDNLRSRITGHVHKFHRREIDDPELRLAGVALVVAPAETGNGACLLLTRRSTKMRRHAGQFALPGGRLDAGLGRALGIEGGPLGRRRGREASGQQHDKTKYGHDDLGG